MGAGPEVRVARARNDITGSDTKRDRAWQWGHAQIPISLRGTNRQRGGHHPRWVACTGYQLPGPASKEQTGQVKGQKRKTKPRTNKINNETKTNKTTNKNQQCKNKKQTRKTTKTQWKHNKTKTRLNNRKKKFYLLNKWLKLTQFHLNKLKVTFFSHT